MSTPPRTLIAGVGNVLRRDDGFGICAARLLSADGDLPTGVRVIETGIGGISLVQELMDDWDRLVVLDAVESDRPPGTLCLRSVEVDDIRELPPESRQSFLADIHFADPTRALMLARALDRLPARVYLVGCAVSDAAMGTELSPPVRQAAGEAVKLLRGWLNGSLALEEKA